MIINRNQEEMIDKKIRMNILRILKFAELISISQYQQLI